MAIASVRVEWDDAGYEAFRPESISYRITEKNAYDVNGTLNAGNGWYQTETVVNKFPPLNFSITSQMPSNYSYTISQPTQNNWVIYMTYSGPKEATYTVDLDFVDENGHKESRPSYVRVYVVGAEGTVDDEFIFNITADVDHYVHDFSIHGADIGNTTAYYETDDEEWYDVTVNSSSSSSSSIVFAYKRIWKLYRALVEFKNDYLIQDERPTSILAHMTNDEGTHEITIPVSTGYQIEAEQDLHVHFDNFEVLDKYDPPVVATSGNDTTVTYTMAQSKMPEIGDHPTTEDLDLMYSLLYDDTTAENAIDIIHILNHGDHDPDPSVLVPFIR